MGGVLPDEQHRQPVERQRVDPEEGRGENALCFGARELPPGGAVVARHGVDAGSLQDRPHRTRRNRVAEPGEFALDPTVTPGGVLARSVTGPTGAARVPSSGCRCGGRAVSTVTSPGPGATVRSCSE